MRFRGRTGAERERGGVDGWPEEGEVGIEWAGVDAEVDGGVEAPYPDASLETLDGGEGEGGGGWKSGGGSSGGGGRSNSSSSSGGGGWRKEGRRKRRRVLGHFSFSFRWSVVAWRRRCAREAGEEGEFRTALRLLLLKLNCAV